MSTEQQILFATYYTPWTGPENRPKIESLTPDARFTAQIRQTHPHSKIVMMTDMETQIDADAADLEVFRCDIDRSKIGRNSYANYYQFKAQVDYLDQLIASGTDTNVIFLDSDILVLGSLCEIFERYTFDYGFTISDAVDMPVNMGIMFVKRGHLDKAREFLQNLMTDYPFHETFTAGQIAIGEYLGIQNVADRVHEIHDRALENDHCIVPVREKFEILFLPCLKYNFCNCGQSCCTDPDRSDWHPKTAEDFERVGLKVVHFVGHRKPHMKNVHQAFLESGLHGAYRAIADMPNELTAADRVCVKT